MHGYHELSGPLAGTADRGLYAAARFGAPRTSRRFGNGGPHRRVATEGERWSAYAGGRRRVQGFRRGRRSDFNHAGQSAPLPRQAIRIAWIQVYGRLFERAQATRANTAACLKRRRLSFLFTSNTSCRGSTAARTISTGSRSPATAATPTKGQTSRALTRRPAPS